MVSENKTQELFRHMIRGYQNILDDNLVGIYLHGSFVLGSFNPNGSDLDYIIVVEQALSIETKKDIMKYTIDYLLPFAPKKGWSFIFYYWKRQRSQNLHFILTSLFHNFTFRDT